MATVPGNSLQESFRNQQKMAKRPSYGMRGKRRATILKVYDRDTIPDTGVPGELARLISTKPGRVYGQVKLNTGEILYLPFQLTPEFLYSVYGDSKLIEGRPANVVFYDRRIHMGEIVIIGDESKPLKETKDSTAVFDIGSIFGG
jgi:hypothetical protein